MQVIKLNNANYSLWKFNIEMILIKEDLVSEVVGKKLLENTEYDQR